MDKIQQTIQTIKPIDLEAEQKAKARLDSLTKPPGSLGRLEEIAERLSGIKGDITPVIRNKVIFTLAADHGVTAEGVSAYPADVTSQMVYNFVNGGAGINVLARHIGARVIIVDMGVAKDFEPKIGIINKKVRHGTSNMAQGPAMVSEEAIRSIIAGIELVEEEYSRAVIDLVGIGDMGIGNTTISSAITAVLTNTNVQEVTGRGTGIDDKSLIHKIEVITKTLKINQPDLKNPIDVLAKVGGFEIGGLVGIILGCAAKKIPVVLDGFNIGAAALLAFHLCPLTKEYMFAGHNSVEKGHKIILKKLGLTPILDLSLRLGEGTGAALAMNIIEAASKIINEMATFDEAAVSQKS